jgi:hypothetical protein
MLEILNSLGISSSEIVIDSEHKCYLHLVNRDKIILICEVEDLNAFQYISAKIPELRKTIIGDLKDKVKDDVVDKERMPLPKFLWDLYIIGIHKILNEKDQFNSIRVAEIERDHFAARKVIIEYINDNELKEQVWNVIYPHQQLDGLMKGLKDASSSVIEKLLNGLDLNLVLNNQSQHPIDVTFEHFSKFLEEAQRVVTPKSGE